ncbi:hypothetical protein, partial [Rummeliibacillus suwonensis]|uniref:hypothetical protein n=1 Tax=Rummeliibacillus suwonensis TaxID=1306154 RepID=UPI001AAE4D24
MRPIGSGQQDVGPSGVATGRGAFNLSSSSSVGIKKIPTDGSFTLSRVNGQYDHPSRFWEKREKIGGGSTARKSPIGSGQQDVDHSGVATGRGAFNLSSSSSVGIKKIPT